MNAENAEYQILLALQSSHYRSRELDSLRTAVGAIVCTRSSKESRTLLAKAFYLTLLAARFEKLLSNQSNQALKSLSRLVSLPDELQWEYRAAHSLGVAGALSRLGQLQEEIIAQIRHCLCDACALIMAQAPDLQLSIHARLDKGRRLDPVEATLLALEPRLGKKMFNVVAAALLASKNALLAARQAADQPSADQSIASIWECSENFTEAEMLASMVAFCLEATTGGGFADEPSLIPVSPSPEDNERTVARLLAAGFVASRVSTLYARQNPILSVCLN